MLTNWLEQHNFKCYNYFYFTKNGTKLICQTLSVTE